MKKRSELSAREVDALQDTLLRRLGDSSVPTLPHVALRILELVSNPNSTFKQFARVIQTDQALSGRLLRMANSPFFAQRNPVTQVERAAIILGMDRLKALALGFHLTKAAASAEGASAHKRTWTLSLFQACLACRLAERFDRARSGEAFIVALMSDAGVPLMPGLIGDRYAQLINESDPPQSRFRVEFNALPFTHVDVAGAMCRLWKLPDLLVKPIAAHHNAPRPFEPEDTPGMLHAIAFYVGGVDLEPPDLGVTAAAIELARTLFGLTPAELRPLIEQAARDLESYKEIFQHILDETISIDSIIEAANAHLTETVAELVEEAEGDQMGAIKRIRTPSFVLEAARTPANAVRVFIDDPSGARILTEEFRPADRSDREIVSILMLQDLPPDDAGRVISTIRNLAA